MTPKNRFAPTDRYLPFLAGLLLLAGACASNPTAPEPLLPFESVARPDRVEEEWDESTGGYITDLHIAEKSQRVLISTIPNPESGKRFSRGYHVAVYDTDDGDLVWGTKVNSPIRGLTLSSDGKVAVFSKYDGEIAALNEKGKPLWSVRGICRPRYLQAQDHFLCFYDDDADNGLAFEVYDRAGQKVASHKAGKKDVLVLKNSSDGAYTAVGRTGGEIEFLNPDYKTRWKQRLRGEVTWIGISSGEKPVTAVLYRDGSRGLKLALLDDRGKIKAATRPDAYVRQVELDPEGKNVFAYGNGPRGQSLIHYNEQLKELWHRKDPHYADYVAPLQVTNDLVIIGFENVRATSGDTSRHTHLLAFNFEGKLKWNIPLKTRHGAYLYVRGYSPETKRVVIGTDNAELFGFEIEPQ